ncbi:MAG: hypothetical protein GC164_15580 [Phycisphaera sp.]|nr:hypothetical protein [Phycisphaera sp.]
MKNRLIHNPKPRNPARSLRVCRWLLPVVLLWPCATPTLLAQTQEVSPGPAHLATEPDRDALLAVAKDVNQPQSARRAAVVALVNSPPPGRTAVLGLLLDPSNEPALLAMTLRAMATTPHPLPEEVVPALYRLLGGVPEGAVRDLGQVLATTADSRIISRLIDTALRSDEVQAKRLASITCLGFTRDKDAAGTLVQLTDEGQPSAVRESALDALEAMTAANQPRDHKAWDAWWSGVRRSSTQKWLDELLANHQHREWAGDAQSAALRDQLIDAQRSLYRATAEADRSALLVAMLNNPASIVASRLLALDLAVQRLTDSQPIPDELRLALIERLKDPSDAVRQRSALLLRDLSDGPAADAVARQLESGEPVSPAVLKAFLLLLARQPRAGVVEPAMGFLMRPDVRGEAAAALTAAADASLMTDDQKSETDRVVRVLLSSSSDSVPQLIELLARVGDEESWGRIADYLSNGDDQARLAAARAWAQSNRPVNKLAQLAGDPIVQSVLYVAATKRCNDLETLRALIAHRPEQEQPLTSWQRAVVAIAGRIDPADVLAIDDELKTTQAGRTLRDQVLAAAINRLMPGEDPIDPDPDPYALAFKRDASVLARLLMRRAALRLEAGDPAQAMADFDRIASLDTGVDPQIRSDMDLGIVEARLALGDTSAAAEHASAVVTRLADQPEKQNAFLVGVAKRFLQTASRNLDAGQPERARLLIDQLKRLVPDASVLPDELHELLDALDRKAVPPKPVTPATPTPTVPDGNTTPPPTPSVEPTVQTPSAKP